MKYAGWQLFEEHCNRLLGLSKTVASGSRWHDPGDGVDRRHHSETDFPLLVDAKYTSKGSFSINRRKIGDWVTRAHEMGRRFAMPIRFEGAEDYVVLRLDDFAELLDSYREARER